MSAARAKISSRGFTLLELLVVIAIIGLLVALLLPAIQAARESGRRAQCSSQLRQMGLALQQYLNTQRVLPKGGPGVASLTNPALRALASLSWGAALLPGLEQQSLYEDINQQQPYLHDDNLAAGQTLVRVYVCPSAPNGDLLQPNGDTPLSDQRFAITNYGGNWGERALRCYPAKNCGNNYSELGDSSGRGRGVLLLGPERAIGLPEVTDGTSHTIAIGEAPGGLHSIWIGHKNVFDQSAPLNAVTQPGSVWDACQPAFRGFRGPHCDFGQEFHSFHPGGAQFLLLDGSAHFMAETVDLKVLAGLLSRCGGEAIGDFQ